MASFEPISGNSKHVACTLLEEKPCSLCEKHNDIEPEITQAKARVIEAEQALQAIKARQRLIRTEINERHDQTSRLPAEIMAEVFKATLTRKVSAGMQPHIVDSPLFLGAICQRWRNIAWSTRALWNWIHIFLCLPAPKYLEELVKEWLDRSGTLPLTIQISCGKGVADADDSDLFFPKKDGIFGNFVDHVNACSPRWQDVNFTVPCTIISFLYGSRLGTPNLEVLKVHTTDGPGFHFDLDQLARPLRLSFGCYPDTLRWNELNIAWDNVIDVYLANFEEDVCVKAIQQMPQLVRCTLVNICNESGIDEPVSDQRFIHQNLKELTFTAKKTGIESESLLDHFVFPNLTRLRIMHWGNSPQCVVYWNGQRRDCLFLWENCIRPFLIHSSSRLTSLDLEVPCEYGSLIETLEEIESLRKLSLNDCFEKNRFDCHSLLVQLAETCIPNAFNELGSPLQEFLPYLEFFSYSGSLDVPPDEKPAFEAILDVFGPVSKLRNPSRRPLNHMVVKPRNSSQIQFKKKDLRRFLRLTDAGITLQLVHPLTGRDLIQPSQIAEARC